MPADSQTDATQGVPNTQDNFRRSDQLIIKCFPENLQDAAMRDYRGIKAGYLAQQSPRQDKIREQYTVFPFAPPGGHYIDKSNSKGLGTVPGDRASLQ